MRAFGRGRVRAVWGEGAEGEEWQVWVVDLAQVVKQGIRTRSGWRAILNTFIDLIRHLKVWIGPIKRAT